MKRFDSLWIALPILVALLAALLAGLGADSPPAAFPTPTATPPPAPPPTETPIATPPPTPSPTVTLAPEQLGTRLTFNAEDGFELVGYFYPAWMPNAPVVVLMHEFRNSQAAWNESAIIPWMQNWSALDPASQPYVYAGGRLPQFPQDRSYAVLTFDFRGHGESLPDSHTADWAQAAANFLMDAQAAYAFARTLPGVDPNRVIGVGASIGADAVVDACGEICSGAFSVSPGNWLNVDYGQAAQAMLERGRPVRCLYAYNDAPSPQTCGSLAPGDLYKVFVYPGIKHGMTFFVPRKMDADFGANLLEFLLAASR